jgi:hypothetical protein
MECKLMKKVLKINYEFGVGILFYFLNFKRDFSMLLDFGMG